MLRKVLKETCELTGTPGFDERKNAHLPKNGMEAAWASKEGQLFQQRVLSFAWADYAHSCIVMLMNTLIVTQWAFDYL